MGQHPLAQPIHGRRYCGSFDVVDHSHRVRHVPGGSQREGHSRHSRRRGHLGFFVALGVLLVGKKGSPTAIPAAENPARRSNWRMPPLGELPPPCLSIAVKTWMFVLRAYLVLAGGLVLVRIVTLAIGQR